MTATIAYLNARKGSAPVKPEDAPPLFVGRRYQLTGGDSPAELHGLCGGFEVTSRHGGVIPVQGSGLFLWDDEIDAGLRDATLLSAENGSITIRADTPVASNRFTLANTTLAKPDIRLVENTHQLFFSVGFDVIYTADRLEAQLGVLHLVNSQCFATLVDGREPALLESAEDSPLLYLTENGNDEAVKPVLLSVHEAEPVRTTVNQDISHPIVEHLDGVEVETLTVLEQYQTFFLQRELPFSTENIWVPVCAPVAWGWSMRVARRYDGEWGIARQKLVMPTVGHNGLEMPAWRGNTLGV